ncbi:MAG: hypothetical protein FWC32_05165 [Firmicutes bacterium]|nr:hypothetical protein [Bacillota bacterium]
MQTAYTTRDLSAYHFMRCLFAALADKKNVIINRDEIVNTIFEFKNRTGSDSMDVFRNIEFRKNIDSVLSSDIEEGINTLQTFGVVGKLNPTYEKIVIFLTQQEALNILNDYESNVQKVMTELASSFGGV